MTNLFALIGLLVVGCWLALAVWITGWWLLLRWRALRDERQRAMSLRSCEAVTQDDATADVVTEGLGAGPFVPSWRSAYSLARDGASCVLGDLDAVDQDVFGPARRVP